MKTIATAIYKPLCQLYGSGEVYHGTGHNVSGFPYQTFNVGAAQLPMRNSGALNKNAVDQIPFTVHVWSKSAPQASDRVSEIRNHFLNNKLNVRDHACIRVTVTSFEVSAAPDPDADGQPVWHGIVIFEAWLVRDSL